MIKPEEEFRPSIDKIMEGIKEFSAAVDARIDNRADPWKPTYLFGWNQLRNRLQEVRVELEKVRQDTQ